MTKITTLGYILSILLAASGTANAQLFDRLKDKVESLSTQTGELKETTDEVAAQSKGKPSLEGGPSEELVSFTNCASIDLTNILVGSSGNYTFQQGFSKEKRSGFINRTKAKASKGCILPSIQARQIIYMEVDTAKYKAMGSSNDWQMQCIRSDDPGAGAIDEVKTEYPYKVNYLAGKDVLLHCGHSVENAETCAEGSNSDRSGKHDEALEARGKTMLSVHGNTSTLAPASGEKLYCQYYNKPSGKSLFAFEYLRTRD